LKFDGCTVAGVESEYSVQNDGSRVQTKEKQANDWKKKYSFMPFFNNRRGACNHTTPDGKNHTCAQ
jgi:hypothetical protein